MTTTWSFILLIFGCAAVTWLPRILPFALVRNITLPTVVLQWLSYIPVCILSALVLDSLFKREQSIVTINWLNVVALLPTLLVAIWTKSLSKTVIAGVVTMAVIRLLV
jgi:branched-subunit amino acid transport protein